MPRYLLAVLLLLPAAAAEGSEGKWTPEQILELDPGWLKAQGLIVPPKRLWDARRGTGLLAGAVNLGGCSAALISPEGLIITNHHCVFSIIQEHSTPERDLIKEGFLARTRAAELPGKAVRVQVPKRFTDVTREVLAAVPEGADDAARFRAVDRKQKELVQACEEKPAARCRVAAFDGGLRFTLVEDMELQDVRLVYAPPRAVGEYGGEIDNWSWPRHTGDFAIARAYTGPGGKPAASAPENVPFKAEFFFPLSPKGASPGEGVMVLGYPGVSFRALLAGEMKERSDRYYPRASEYLAELLAILEKVEDPAGKIAVASHAKGLANRKKNADGQMAGFERGRIVDRTAAAEDAVVAWARAAGKSEGLAARDGLAEELAKLEKTWDKELLLQTLAWGSRAMWLAATVARLSTEREKPDLDRDPQFMDRELARLKDRLEREQKNLHAPADQKLFAAWVRRAQALPADTRIAGVDAVFGAKSTPAELDARIARMFSATKVLDLDARRAMVGARPDPLRAAKDPLLDFGFALAAELDALKELQDRRAGASLRLRPPWRKLVQEHAKRPVAPDANGTLRVSFGKVAGYAPRDGVIYTPQTTIAGMLAKATGADPFIVPEKVARAAGDKRSGRFVDPRLGDVPLDFLSELDTTGGNSGSPIVNGRGELVGVNFDRVWENVANDFGYVPEVARNISVDVRYALWLLDQVEDAKELLTELRVR